MPYGHLSRDELLDLLRTRDLARADERKRREQIRLELLAQAAPFLAQPIEYEEKLEAITRLVVPRVADFSSIDLVEGGMLRKVVAYHPRRSKQRALDRLVHRPPGPIPDSVRLVLETAKARRRDLAPDLSAGRIRDQTCLEVLQQLGVGWTILAPLVAHRRVVGILCLTMAESGRRYDDADVALAKRHKPDPGKLQALEQRSDIFLIAGKAIKRLGDDDVERRLPSSLKHRLISRPKRGRAAHRCVAIDLDHCPTLARDPLFAEPDLVVDRSGPLLVRRIASIDDGAHAKLPQPFRPADLAKRTSVPASRRDASRLLA